MRARPVLLVLALLSALALTAPAAAPAADSDVEAAWKSEDAALKAGGTKVSRAVRAAQRSKFRRVASAVKAIRAVETLIATVRQRVTAASASTVSGARARDTVLASLKGYASSLKNLRLAFQAAGHKRKLATARRLLARSSLDAGGASDDASDARLYFEAARADAEQQRRQEQQQQQQQQNPPPDGGGGGSQPPPTQDPPPPQPPQQTCAQNPNQAGCPAICKISVTFAECQKPPPSATLTLASRHLAALL